MDKRLPMCLIMYGYDLQLCVLVWDDGSYDPFIEDAHIDMHAFIAYKSARGLTYVINKTKKSDYDALRSKLSNKYS